MLLRVSAMAATIGLVGPASAGWFGPSTYDECMFDKINEGRGQAAYLVEAYAKNVCREKFPCPKDEIRADAGFCYPASREPSSGVACYLSEECMARYR